MQQSKSHPFILLTLFFFFSCNFVLAQDISDFIKRVEAAEQSQKPALIDSFLQVHETFPVFDNDTTSYVFYRGAVNKVSIASDLNFWDSEATLLNRLSGTDFYYDKMVLDAQARIDYKLVENGTNWILDPLNPNTAPSGYGDNSEIAMPAYPDQPELRYYEEIPKGSVSQTIVRSPYRGRRRLRIYTPSGYDNSSEAYQVAVFNDGFEYLDLAKAANILDYLIHHQIINPIIGVFVPPVDRTEEYTDFDVNRTSATAIDYLNFLDKNLMPYVDENYRTLRTASDRAILGPSHGGNISLLAGAYLPEQFGNIGAVSPTVVFNMEQVYGNFRCQDSVAIALIDVGCDPDGPKQSKFHIDYGVYEWPANIDRIHDFKRLLDRNGYNTMLATYPEGHSWGNWSGHLEHVLVEFFPYNEGTSSDAVEAVPKTIVLGSNYPNPFNPSTTIPFSLKSAQHVRLEIFDLTGKHIQDLLSSTLSAGNHTVVWDARHVASGVYLYRLTTDQITMTRKMVLVK